MDPILPLLIPDDGFFTDVWQQRPAHFAPSAPPVPITLDDISRALSDGLLRHPYLELVTEHGSVPPDDYCPPRTLRHSVLADCPDPATVSRFVDAGATMLLRNVEHWHRPTTRMAAALAQETGRQVEAFCFVTPPGTQGRPVHKDDADVIVLQTAGRKRWRIHQLPLDRDGASGLVAVPGPLALEPDLRPGDVLYVPRGCPHSAAAGDDGLSVHLSFTLREVSTADLADALRTAAPAALQAKPLGDAALLGAAAEVLAAARRRLDALTPDALLADARRRMLGRQVPVPPQVSLGAERA